ncbi:metallophosphoesterase [candidate division WOR-3 bacterium]|nr:metallophosphoesterase [candidate division WOR-3 bacterium]
MNAKIRYLIGFISALYFLYGFGPFSSRSYLTPTATPEQSIVISWNSETEESTIVAYGPTIGLEDTVRLDSTCFYHHVELFDLTPGQTYYYQVLPAGNVRQFTTFPSSSTTFEFSVIGDTRTDSVAHQSVIDQIAAYPKVLMMHAGDMVNDGNNEIDWRTYFNIEDTVIQDYHLVPAIGNHETPYWPYDTLFALPDSEDYYSVRYGNAHFTVLNTEMDLYGAQRDWLISDLETAHNDSTIDWIFVNFHRPPYSSGYGHGSQIDVRDAWCSLLEQYSVDIVFNGHDHDYERTIPINGVVYIVTGGGGAPLHGVGYSSWTAYAESTYQLCHASINERVCTMRAIKPDGTVFDSLIIDKTIGIQEMQERSPGDMSIDPNPFSDEISIRVYAGSKTGLQELKIYDITGTIIKDLSFMIRDPKPVIIWDGTDNNGLPVTSGVYYITYADASGRHAHKVVKIVR